MITFSEDTDMREEYRSKGFARAKEFDWNKTARETLDVYKEIVTSE